MPCQLTSEHCGQSTPRRREVAEFGYFGFGQLGEGRSVCPLYSGNCTGIELVLFRHSRGAVLICINACDRRSMIVLIVYSFGTDGHGT